MVKGIMRTIFSSFLGKVGFFLLLAFGIAAVVVTVVFPPDFGQRIWNNPVYWADYPKTAIPSWWPEAGGKAQHQVLIATTPTNMTEEGAGKTLEYRFAVGISSQSDPKFLSFSISHLQFQDVSPVIAVLIEQDGQFLPLYSYVVPGRFSGEESPISRYATEPFRVQLTSDYQAEGMVKELLSGLRNRGQDRFTAVVRLNFASREDSVEEVRFIAGGESFGWLGTDDLGRDVATGILAGLPIELLIGFVVAFSATALGAVIGTASAYFGGWVDLITQRVIDVLTMVPTLPIVMFLVFAFGANLAYIILFLIVFGWTGLAIQIRPWIMQIQAEGFITMAKARGLSDKRIIVRHLLPQTLPFLFVTFTFSIPGAILSEAGLSFLGLGDPSVPTWGQMLQQGFRTGAIYLGYWWWILAPGLAIVLTSLAPALIAQSLEPYTEPRLRRG